MWRRPTCCVLLLSLGLTAHVANGQTSVPTDGGDVVGARFIPSHFAPLGELNASSGQSIQFNTSDVTFSIGSRTKKSGVIAQTRRATETAVFCFTNITIANGANVTLTGDRPIAILSLADITIAGTLDASGGNGTGASGGLGRLGGGNGGTGQMAAKAPTAGAGPGAGGMPPQLWAWHGGGGGGYGGAGGFAGTGSGGPAPGGLTYNTAGALEIDLLGGSGGGGGYHYGGDPGGGCAGAGGGAMELVASGNITISSGGRIFAKGGNGPDANWRSGGGGGSGGMVLLSAAGTICLEPGSQIIAAGGNGGSSYDGAGGGGGGGGGGQIVVCHQAGLVNQGQISTAAGSGGVGPTARGEDGHEGRILVRQLGATLNAPGDLAFGQVKPGAAVAVEFPLENFDLLAAVTSLVVAGPDSQYFKVLSPTGTFTVTPGEANRVTVLVRFGPDRQREYEARLEINSGGGSTVVRLLGTGRSGAVRPVVYYRMDDDGEPTKITDSSGGGFDGQRKNMRACHWVEGRFGSGGALDFDGLDDHIDVPALRTMSAVTLALWVKPDKLTSHRYSSLYSCNGWASGDLALRFRDDGTLEFAVCGNTGGNVSADVVNSIYDRFEEHAGAHWNDAYKGYWIHLAVVYNAAARTADFYVNGRPNVRRTFATARPASFAGGQIGGWDGGGRNSDGVMDEFRIYDRALSAEQVEELARFEPELWAVRDSPNWKSPSTVIHVNGQAGRDVNPGTQEKPVATIGKALALIPGPGTKVLVYPGTYREANLQLTQSGTRFEPIIVEAKEPSTVVISGSEIWSGWQSSGATGTYTHSWPYDWGLSKFGYNLELGLADICRRREMVFVDGELYAQVLNPVGAPAKRFYVDEGNNKLYLFMAPGQSPADHRIEVVTNDSLFRCSRDYYVLRGLVFQHANPFTNEGVAGRAGGSHVLVEDCSFIYSNNDGLGFGDAGSEDIVVRRCTAHHNGIRGISPAQPVFDTLVEDWVTNYSNWRGRWGNYLGPDQAGIKTMFAKHMVVRRHESANNWTKGLWFDCDNRDILVEDCRIISNLTDGLWSEINLDAVTIRACVIAHNQKTGVVVANSEHLMLENNRIFGNNSQQFGMWEPDEYRGNPVQGTKLVTHHLVLHGNWIVGETSAQKLLDWAGWWSLYATMNAQNNRWYRPGETDGFFVGGSNRTWMEWKDLVPDDTTSAYLLEAPELRPPMPDPLGWQSKPTATSNTSIVMTATTATDADGVEYYFSNLTDRTHDSGWQSKPTYQDTGLAPGRKYFYRVRARDRSVEQNETWWSVPAWAVTADTTNR